MEVLVKMEAIREVEVAVVVAFKQFANAQYVEALKRRPVPIPF